MAEWIEQAVEQPWPFFSLLLLWGLWKSGRWIAGTLFDEDGGLIPDFFEGIREDSAEMKKTISGVAKQQAETLGAFRVDIMGALAGNEAAITSMERQLVNAIQSAPDDRELFEILFTENPIPICYVQEDGRFSRVNYACEDFWGYSAGELSEMKFQEVTVKGDVEADLENAERVKSGAMSRYRMSKTYVRKDGEHVEADLHVFRYPQKGVFLHFISIIIPD